MAMQILIPSLPAMAADLRISPGDAQLTITLYLTGLAIGQLIHGPLSDRFGRRPVLLVALAAYTLAGVAAILAQNIAMLILARIVQALRGCAGLVLGRAVIRDVLPAKEAASQLALVNLVMSLSPAGAPLIGGYLTVLFGWRAIFVLLAAVGAATLIAALLGLPETAPPRQGGPGGFAAMLETYPRLLGSARFRGYTIAGAASTTAFYAFMAASPFIFVDVLHRPTEEVGLYYLVLMFGITFGSFAASRLVLRFPSDRLLRAAISVAGLGAVGFFAITVAGLLSVPGVLASMFVFMLGAGLASPLALTSAISTQPGMVGAASGLYGCNQMGYGALRTLVVSLWHHNAALPAALVLLASAVLAQVALHAAARPRRKQPPGDATP
ncbi:MAG: multidrug effflux MFS transporter [Proteobacteria bacterium]|nr:multidrug effflux MFS transporter [Pseudomonadota bacterium]